MKNYNLSIFVSLLLLQTACTTIEHSASYPEDAKTFEGLKDLIQKSKSTAHLVLMHGMMHGEVSQERSKRVEPGNNLNLVPLEKALIRNKLALPGAKFQSVHEVDHQDVRVNDYTIELINGKELILHEVIYSLHFARGSDEDQSDPPVYDKRDLFSADLQLNEIATTSNRFLKQKVMNWGMADAVMYMDPEVGKSIRMDIRSALRGVHRRYPEAEASIGYLCSSLGAKIFFDTLLMIENEYSAAVEKAENGMDIEQQDVLDEHANTLKQEMSLYTNASTLYFFANQLALLELGRPTIKELAMESNRIYKDKVLTLVSFSQPEDPLTYEVTPLLKFYAPDGNIGIRSFDFSVENGTWPIALFTNPVKAHTGHKDNKYTMNLLVNGYSKSQ